MLFWNVYGRWCREISQWCSLICHDAYMLWDCIVNTQCCCFDVKRLWVCRKALYKSHALLLLLVSNGCCPLLSGSLVGFVLVWSAHTHTRILYCSYINVPPKWSTFSSLVLGLSFLRINPFLFNSPLNASHFRLRRSAGFLDKPC